MSMSKEQLKQGIITELEVFGATANGDYSWVDKFAEAIANAVVDHITTNAEVVIDVGSSSGTYPVN